MEIIRAEKQRDFFEIVQLRTDVFVLEQEVDIKIEQDQRDLFCIHYLARLEDKPVGCLRILDEDDHVSIGRVAVRKEMRGKHIGKALMLAIENDPLVKEKGIIQLHAQLSAKDFYEKCGYAVTSDIYLEAGIEHVMMEKKL